jgi:hypothetical protein
VSVAAVYDKLNGVETRTSAGLVRYASEKAGAVPSPLPGLRPKLFDGNCQEKSQHRIKETRDISAGSLPGESLVAYVPSLRLPIDVFPFEKGHAQEPSLLDFNIEPSTNRLQTTWRESLQNCHFRSSTEALDSNAPFFVREKRVQKLRNGPIPLRTDKNAQADVIVRISKIDDLFSLLGYRYSPYSGMDAPLDQVVEFSREGSAVDEFVIQVQFLGDCMPEVY